MITALFVTAAILVALASQLRVRRRGVLDGGALLRDLGIAGALLYLAIEGSRFWIDFAWWRELGQAATFWQYLRIRWLPQTALAVVAGLGLMLAFGVARTRLFGLVGYTAAALLGIVISVNVIDPWVLVLFLGAHSTGAYTDPIFHKDLAFYIFRLPLYQ